MTKLHADFIRKAILLSILCDVCDIRLTSNILKHSIVKWCAQYGDSDFASYWNFKK